jgi:hypothetical protein
MGEEKEITWRAAEYEYVEKGAEWYWVVGTLGAILAMIALWQRNFFFFVFVVVAGTMLVVFGRRRPRVLDFTVGEKGVGVGSGSLLPYDQLEWFAVHEREGRMHEIVFKKKTTVNPIVRLPADVTTVRHAARVLEERLPREQYEASLLDTLSELLGF